MCNKDESKLFKDESEFPREKSWEKSFTANDRSRGSSGRKLLVSRKQERVLGTSHAEDMRRWSRQTEDRL